MTHEDLISRQAAIDHVDAVFPVDPMKSEFAQGIACGAALAKTFINQLPSAQPKKKLTFSERQKIVYAYHDWCLLNNAFDCAETFLAYLCVKGFIDG